MCCCTAGCCLGVSRDTNRRLSCRLTPDRLVACSGEVMKSLRVHRAALSDMDTSALPINGCRQFQAPRDARDFLRSGFDHGASLVGSWRSGPGSALRSWDSPSFIPFSRRTPLHGRSSRTLYSYASRPTVRGGGSDSCLHGPCARRGSGAGHGIHRDGPDPGADRALGLRLDVGYPISCLYMMFPGYECH